jgi:hypothetical protein
MMISIYGFEDKRGSQDVDGFGDVEKGILNVIPSFLRRLSVMWRIMSKIGTCIHNFGSVLFMIHMIPL